MTILWKDAVTQALERFSERHNSIQVDRALFIKEELEAIVSITGSVGNTPAQTVSRVLQELRDDDILFFSSSGRYVLNKSQVDATLEDFPEDMLDNAVKVGNLRLEDVPTSSEIGQTRLRKGVAALRNATLHNYGFRCALCDIEDKKLLVTSHVARWTDRPDARGKISNTVCFCGLHDKLFEHGYFALSDDLKILVREPIKSNAIQTWLKSCTSSFRIPLHRPAELYLQEHRHRVGL